MDACVTDFDDWLVATFARAGAFTMLIGLVEIGAATVTPLSASYLHVVGDETRWPDMVALLAGAGTAWDGAAFFQADRAGLVADPIAAQRLAALGRAIVRDRSILNDGDFFDRSGLRLRLEQVAPH
jgi:hypothetical protein